MADAGDRVNPCQQGFAVLNQCLGQPRVIAVSVAEFPLERQPAGPFGAPYDLAIEEVVRRARVTRGEDELLLEENQSTFIPQGTKHRLENAGEAPLYIVEVQSGAYLGEDDIVRFDDRYNRT